jgi:hypothetical protein
MNPTLTAQNGNIMTGTLPANASGFNAQGDIVYNTAPKAPVGSAVVTSQPAAEAYKNSAAWMANEQNQAAVRASNAALQKQTDDANSAASKTQNTKTSVATDALAGFVRTSNNTEKLSAGDQARVDEIKRINDQLTGLATQMDTRAASQVQSVIDQYASLSRRQEVANASYEGGVSTAGLSSGRNRYAPEIQAGVQSAAVASGIQALSDLQVKKQSLINEIEQARDTQKFKVLTEKVQELKTLQKDERDAAQQMKDNFYKEQTYIRETQKYVVGDLASKVATLLTGDPTHDQETYASIAKQNGVSQVSLEAAVDEYKQKQATAGGANIQEYHLAQSQGFKGTWMDYNRAIKPPTGGSGGSITKDEAISYGWPISMVGLNESTVRNSLSSPTVPEWYRTLAASQQGMPLTDSVITPMWNEWRKKTSSQIPVSSSGYANPYDPTG